MAKYCDPEEYFLYSKKIPGDEYKSLNTKKKTVDMLFMRKTFNPFLWHKLNVQ